MSEPICTCSWPSDDECPRHSAEKGAPRWRKRPLTEADLEWIAAEHERHRAQGCRVHDDPFAKCTCPIPPAKTD